jgi:hypothetical protein
MSRYIKSAREKFDSFVEKLTEIEALYLDGEEETIAANRAFEKVIIHVIHLPVTIFCIYRSYIYSQGNSPKKYIQSSLY